MDDIAVATKVFKRTEDLRRLLRSVERAGIQSVYVSDDGESGEHSAVYDETWEFDLTVINLPFDTGLGEGRRRFVEESTEDYLLVVDTDHEIPSNYAVLQEVLDQYPALGGVAGITIENGTIGGMCHDIKVDNGVLIRHAPHKNYEWTSGHPVLQFDFIPNAALFRRECVEEYNWDPAYVIGKEHLDFYYGHHLRTDWEFAICPEVTFPHHETTDDEFLKFRLSETREMESKKYFLNKWGLDQIQRRSYWLDETPHADPIAVRLSNSVPLPLGKRILDLNDWYRTQKGKIAPWIDERDR